MEKPRPKDRPIVHGGVDPLAVVIGDASICVV